MRAGGFRRGAEAPVEDVATDPEGVVPRRYMNVSRNLARDA